MGRALIEAIEKRRVGECDRVGVTSDPMAKSIEDNQSGCSLHGRAFVDGARLVQDSLPGIAWPINIRRG